VATGVHVERLQEAYENSSNARRSGDARLIRLWRIDIRPDRLADAAAAAPDSEHVGVDCDGRVGIDDGCLFTESRQVGAR
jgi:hypothetical protein